MQACCTAVSVWRVAVRPQAGNGLLLSDVGQCFIDKLLVYAPLDE